MPVPPEYWGSAHELSYDLNAPSFASGPEIQDPWGVTGCEAGHHCQRGPVPEATPIWIPLGSPPTKSYDYRVQVQISDPSATQANTIIQGQRWWIAGDPGKDLWGHTHDTEKLVDNTCYGEDIEQRINRVNGSLVRGKSSWVDFDCGYATPPQSYYLQRRTRKFRGRWVWQYEDYNKILPGSPYDNGRLYNLRIEGRNGQVGLAGEIAPTLPALSLQIDLRWWRRDPVT